MQVLGKHPTFKLTLLKDFIHADLVLIGHGQSQADRLSNRNHEGADYPAVERQIHLLLNAARHGPEEDGTRRTSSRGAGTEWFITRLPFVIAIAESVGLRLSMTDEHKVSVNEVLEECELEDWMLS